MANIISWFEISTTDFDRAIAFYSALVGKKLEKMPEMPNYAFFPMEEMGPGGALQQVDGYEPSAQGTIIYLNLGEDLSEALARVEPAGGKILVHKTLISEEFGYFAHFLDTEGNRIGLHSQK
jgi:uncharacterized protein